MKISLGRKLIFIPIVIVALFFASIMVKSKKKPKLKGGAEAVTNVNTLKVQQVSVVPHAIGYGTVQPAKVWKAIVEVSGQIVWKADRLYNGEFFKKGELLIRIDQIPWKLAVIQAKAEVAKSEAKLSELTANKNNLEATLKIREQMVAFSEKELQRKKQLFKKRTISASDIDKEQLTVLNHKNSLQQTKSELNLLPKKIAYEQGQLSAAKAKLEKAELDLERTEIRAPFDCRIASVNAEVTQFARAGDLLLESDWIGRSEVEAQFDSSQFFVLVDPENRPKMANKIPLPPAKRFKVQISMKSGAKEYYWPAKCDRIDSEIDPETRTVGLVAYVDDTYDFTNGKNTIPLIKGMFCSVKVYGKPRENVLVVPRAAVHGDTVYVKNAEDRLEVRKVKIAFNLLEYSVLENGIKSGDEIIVTDVVPAIEGMKLNPQRLTDFYQQVEQAIGLNKADLKEKKDSKLASDTSSQGGI